MTKDDSKKLRVALGVLSGRITNVEFAWEAMGRSPFRYGDRETIDDARLQAEEIVFGLLCKLSPFEEEPEDE